MTNDLVENTAPQQYAGKFPRYPHDFADLAACIREFVLPGYIPSAPPLTTQSRVMTLGSCFSRHIAENLAGRGMEVHKLELVEATTTPELVRSALRDNPPAGMDALIVTLGIGEGTLGANVNAIWDICRIGSMHCSHTIVTVSPATMNRSVLASTVVADCLSKSLLRVAVDVALAEWTQPERVSYWPSFEIVRWLGAHLPRSVYGTTDGVCRHVDLDIVALVMAAWCEAWIGGDWPYQNAEPLDDCTR